MSGGLLHRKPATTQVLQEESQRTRKAGVHENGAHTRKSRGKHNSRLRMLLGTWLAVVALAVFILIPAAYIVDPQIHSCSVYLPTKAKALASVFESLAHYAEAEGVWMLLNDLAAVLRSEVFGWAPIPELIPLVSGKHLLMIGGARTWLALQRARQLGVKLTLVDDSKIEKEVGSYVHSFIGLESFGRVSVVEQEKVLAAIQNHSQGGVDKLDGVFTLVEDHGPLVSYVAHHLGLPASPESASKIARSKFLVRKAMDDAGLRVPRYALIENNADLRSAADAVGFPAFLKPVYGVQATFAARVSDMAELAATFEKFQSSIDTGHHPIYNYGTQMILESLLGGPEVQLELMVLEGNVVFHSFSSEYSTQRDTLSFPVRLSDAERESQLKLASDTVQAIGLTHGLLHFELFQDPVHGSHVIEINNRLSRGFLPRNFAHQQLFATRSVDYYGSVYALAVSQMPAFRVRARAPLSIAMYLDEPSTDWWTVDPKDAPNRGWESEGYCGVFVAPTAEEAWEAGRPFQTKRRQDRAALEREVQVEELAVVMLSLVVVGVSGCASVFFLF